jgi:uncharacterized protein
MLPRVCFAVLLILVLTGCGGSAPPADDPTATVTAAVLSPTLAVVAPPSEIPASATPLPPSQTPAPSPTPAPSLTPTATPVPMSIQAMRAGSYPGSDIAIEKELAPGSNYHRYYASYQSDGLKIYGLLTVPDGEAPQGGWPAIVFNHGFIPPQVYRTTERYIAYVDRLARAGYVVYKIDYRGHDASEGTARGAYGDPGYEDDVLNALASLQRFSQVNPKKIGMWGHSMGGFLTLRAMVISKNIRAAVIWSGVVGSYADLMYNWHRGATPTPAPNARGWRREWIAKYGTPEQNPAFWNSVSATAFLADLSGPLELHASLTDEEVPAQFSQDLANGVQAANKSVKLYTYKEDDHNLSVNFTTAMDRTIEFFDKNLK